LSPKYLALVVLGIIIFSSIFAFANVGYPTGNPIHMKINKMPKEQIIFMNQSINKYSVGLNSSYFIPTGNGTIWIEGYILNGTSGAKISDTLLTVAAGPYSTYYSVSSNGYYRIGVLKTGRANLAFFVYGYNTVYHYFNFITSGTVWLNLSFRPSEKYYVHGFTIFNGTHIPDVFLFFTHGKSIEAQSNSVGSYEASLYNGTYIVSVSKPGFAANVTPETITVNGKNLFQNITLYSSGIRDIVVSGFVKNTEGNNVGGAQVIYDGTYVYANATGFYTINVSAGPVLLLATAPGYGYGNATLMVTSNVSNVNITLPVADPILGGKQSSIISHMNQSSIIANSSGIYVLRGLAYYNDSGLIIPITNHYINFTISVQGTGFYIINRTNNLGYYNITLLSEGYYNFTAYAPGFYPDNFSVAILKAITVHNLVFVPLPGSSDNVRFNIGNYTSPIPYNITVYSGGVPVANLSFNGSGNISLMQGNYTFSISSPGYITEKFNESISSNTVITKNLTPAASLGVGISQSTPLSVPISYSPSLNASSISGVKMLYLNLTFVDNGRTVDNSEFEMFMIFDTKEYRYLGNTSAAGTDNLTLYYSGYYHMRFYFLDYKGNLSVNLTADTHENVNLINRTLYRLSFDLYNYSRFFNLTGQRIPEANIIMNGGSFEIKPSLADNGSRLYVNYTLPRSNYTFTYSNASFLPFHNYTQLSSNMSISSDLKPYLIVVENESVTSWYFSILSGSGVSPSVNYTGRTVKTEVAYLLTAGTYEFKAFLKVSNVNPVNSTAVKLNSTFTTRTVVFNVTNVVKSFKSQHVYGLIDNSTVINQFNITGSQSAFVTGYIHNITFIGFNVSINNTTMYIETNGMPNVTEPINSDNVTIGNIYINPSSEIVVIINYPAADFTKYYRQYLNGTIQEYQTSIEVI